MRSFLDAVADTLPRTPAAPHTSGKPFAAGEPQRLPGARNHRAAEVAAGMDAGVRISLRLDLSAYQLFEDGEGAHRAGAAVVQVHSLADPTLVVDAAALWEGDADTAFGPRARVDAALAVRRAARVWPPLDRLSEQDVPDVLALSEEELSEPPASPRPASARPASPSTGPATSPTTSVPPRWCAPRPARPRTAPDSSRARNCSSSAGSSPSRLPAHRGARWTPCSAEAHRPVVRLRDQWVLVDPALVRKARKRELGLLDPVDALSVALTGTAEVDGETVEAVPVGALATLRDRLTAGITPVQLPPGLQARLRDYQLRGLAWLDLMTSLGLGGCLADDMGLGKTITVIALHLRRDRGEPTLVVCPASLMGNWQREINRFAPGVPVRRFHGPTAPWRTSTAVSS